MFSVRSLQCRMINTISQIIKFPRTYTSLVNNSKPCFNVNNLLKITTTTPTTCMISSSFRNFNQPQSSILQQVRHMNRNARRPKKVNLSYIYIYYLK
jgi:hypothetical protein